jgi:hypothetical protein
MRPSKFLLSTAAGVAAVMIAGSASAGVAFGVSVGVAPPPIPVYAQPPIPGPGYVWTPGYWAWGEGDYYWVPGAWVLPPDPGLYWTPAYWAWSGGAFVWNAGYWGPVVGFYGGVDYGFGYGGVGYDGGYWRGRNFYYNRVVNNFGGTRITNVYNRPVSPANLSRVSYNGGPGGLHARPTSQQLAAASARHLPQTRLQAQNERAARSDRALLASVNRGKPPIAATAHPGRFSGPGVVAAARAGGSYTSSGQNQASRPLASAGSMQHERAGQAQSRPLASAGPTQHQYRSHATGGAAREQQQARLTEGRTAHGGAAPEAQYNVRGREEGPRARQARGYADAPPRSHADYRSAEGPQVERGYGPESRGGPGYGGEGRNGGGQGPHNAAGREGGGGGGRDRERHPG